jgi:glycosyltransferase involved in cell wall biosynthesis
MYLPPTIDGNLRIEKTHFQGAGLPRNERPNGPISIFYLITSLEVGGAQMMLYKLLAGMDRTRFSAQVVSLIDLDLGPLREKFKTLPIRLRSLGMRPGTPNPLSVLRLARWLRAERPAVISTWMYHADLVGGLAAKLAGDIPVVWGIRQGDLSREGNRWLTLKTVKACALASRWLPARIICNSEASRKVHAAVGYEAAKMIVIPNGSDLTTFKPNPFARRSVRRELEIPDGSPIIGIVGRFHPHKDHQNFIRAAALLHRDRPDVHFLLCGDEVTWDNPHLAAWIDDAGLRGRCRLLGRRHDIPRLTAALDIAVSSSFGESFSTVVGEAMSCGVPCVVTDVGDSALIVGQTGLVVPAQNSKELAKALGQLVELGQEARASLGMAARCRIKEHFDLPDIVARYQNLYQELADGEIKSPCLSRDSRTV